MPVKLVVALTDPEWFQYLRGKSALDEVNFWAPSPRSFRALTAGEFFLFRLHAPYRTIVGGGIFARAEALPCWLAWDAFQEANGAGSLARHRAYVAQSRGRSVAAGRGPQRRDKAPRIDRQQAVGHANLRSAGGSAKLESGHRALGRIRRSCSTGGCVYLIEGDQPC
jgi:hypothetical protein